MLSNAYFLAKFRFDTAENEPAKNFQKFANFAAPNPLTVGEAGARTRSSGGTLPIRPSDTDFAVSSSTPGQCDSPRIYAPGFQRNGE